MLRSQLQSGVMGWRGRDSTRERGRGRERESHGEGEGEGSEGEEEKKLEDCIKRVKQTVLGEI